MIAFLHFIFGLSHLKHPHLWGSQARRHGCARFNLFPNRGISKDHIFKAAHIVFKGYMANIRDEGKHHSQPKPTIDRNDANKLYKVFMDTPNSLQHWVFYELCMHFGRRGREGLRLLRKGSFQLKKDARGLYSMINELHSAPLQAQPCLPLVSTTFGAIR